MGKGASFRAMAALGGIVGLGLLGCAVKERPLPGERTRLGSLEAADAGAGQARAPNGEAMPVAPEAEPEPGSEAPGLEAPRMPLEEPAESSMDRAEGQGQFGAACTTSADCATEGGCVDGVCCNSNCAERCAACDLPGSEGVCAASESDPACAALDCQGEDSECRSFDRSQRALNCESFGVCRSELNCPEILEPPGTPCAAGAGECDGAGSCLVPEKASLGEACGVDGDCAEGHCVASAGGAGLCCNSACEQACQGCNDRGECVAQTGAACTAGERPGRCLGGACRAITSSNGGSCSEDADCSSGVCTPEGFCCESRCDGVCEQCNAAGQCLALDSDSRCEPVDCNRLAEECYGGERLTGNLCLGRGRCKTLSDCGPGNFQPLPARAPCDGSTSRRLCDGAGNCIDPTVQCGGESRPLRDGLVCCRRQTNGVVRESFSSTTGCPTALDPNSASYVAPIRCDEQSDCREGRTCCLLSASGTLTVSCLISCNSSPVSSANAICRSPAVTSPTFCACAGTRQQFPGWGFCPG